MNITPESKPISEIFSIEGKSSYNIPIYQRNYSWNDNNIEELYNDVINEDAGYYIGNLLITPSSKNQDYDVVDGQQRLTTIVLFFLAIHEELTNIGRKIENPEEIGRIFSLKEDIRRKLLIQKGVPKLKLLNPDSEVFVNYLQVLDGKSKGKFGNRTFGKRYKFIQELILNKEENSLSSKFEELNKFYNKLNEVELLRITVKDLTDAYSVFTSLNAKGLPLTLIDLLKSYYLSEAVSYFSEKEALEEWNKLIEVFTNEEGEPNSTAVTQFLQNNYDAFEGEGTSSITKRASLRKYEQLFKKRGYQYMETLILHAKIFSTMAPKIKNDEDIEYSNDLKETIIKLSKLESSPVYPLMFFLLKKLYQKRISEEVVESIFSYLISYYVRRNIVLKPKSSNIRAKAIQAVRSLQKVERDLDSKSLSLIKENLDQISTGDEEFLTALKGSVYDISPQTVRFILIEIERKNGTYFNKQNKDNLNENYENGKPIWSLEHILPQNPNLKDNWKEVISPENIDLAENLQKENMHKLGNLTLTGYNSEMSDKRFIEKRDYKPKGSEEYTGLRTKLFINNLIFDEEEKIESKETWTIEDINKRTNKLAELVLKNFS